MTPPETLSSAQVLLLILLLIVGLASLLRAFNALYEGERWVFVRDVLGGILAALFLYALWHIL